MLVKVLILCFTLYINIRIINTSIVFKQYTSTIIEKACKTKSSYSSFITLVQFSNSVYTTQYHYTSSTLEVIINVQLLSWSDFIYPWYIYSQHLLPPPPPFPSYDDLKRAQMSNLQNNYPCPPRKCKFFWGKNQKCSEYSETH